MLNMGRDGSTLGQPMDNARSSPFICVRGVPAAARVLYDPAQSGEQTAAGILRSLGIDKRSGEAKAALCRSGGQRFGSWLAAGANVH
jgi:hypothetical protein